MSGSASSGDGDPGPLVRPLAVTRAGPAETSGKSTLVSAVSEITPLRTEVRLSQLGASVDDLTGLAGKTTTTVALDFGRITVSSEVVLYLFGTPGQDRFWFMWKELSVGALGAVVLADTRRRTRSATPSTSAPASPSSSATPASAAQAGRS